MFLTDRNILVFDEIDSTNNYAKQKVAEKVEEGTVVLAHYQKTGRGQQGNFWESEAGKNLLFSLILYPSYLSASKQFYISKIVSLALLDLLKSLADNVHIKWPNDIYVGEKKIAGMLIENTVKGMNLESSVVGIGLNVNQEEFLSDAPNPISIKNISGKEIPVADLLNEFLICFSKYEKLLKSGSEQEIDEMYMSSLFRGKGWYKYRKDNEEFEAQIMGIGEFGQLQLQLRSGEESEFMFKEVEFVL